VELAGMLTSIDESILKDMGERMAHIAARRYRWEFVAGQYAELLG
jgi:hypothetical protein